MKKAELKKQKTRVLQRWADSLNHWTWPKDLPGKPEGFDGMVQFFKAGDPRRGTEFTKHDFITIARNKIIEVIKERAKA